MQTDLIGKRIIRVDTDSYRVIDGGHIAAVTYTPEGFAVMFIDDNGIPTNIDPSRFGSSGYRIGDEYKDLKYDDVLPRLNADD